MRAPLFAAVAGAALAAAAPATAITTFNSYLPANGCGGVVTGGITFSSGNGSCVGAWDDNPVSTNGTRALIYGFGDLVMTRANGGTFNLGTFLSGISWYSAQTEATLTATATYANNSTASGTFTIGQGFATNSMGGGFYKKLVVTGLADGYVAMDNMAFTLAGGVPEPASWAMLIAGFGLVGAAARRRRTALAA